MKISLDLLLPPEIFRKAKKGKKARQNVEECTDHIAKNSFVLKIPLLYDNHLQSYCLKQLIGRVLRFGCSSKIIISYDSCKKNSYWAVKTLKFKKLIKKISGYILTTEKKIFQRTFRYPFYFSALIVTGYRSWCNSYWKFHRDVFVRVPNVLHRSAGRLLP